MEAEILDYKQPHFEIALKVGIKIELLKLVHLRLFFVFYNKNSVLMEKCYCVLSNILYARTFFIKPEVLVTPIEV